MAITQPSYPVQTQALVTHIGSYVDAREVDVEGQIATHASDTTVVHGIDNTALVPQAIVFNVTWPARPGAAVVFWMGGDASSDDPSANMDVGDVWFPSSA